MKAARLHAYHDALKLDSIDEPKITGPLDVIVRIGAAGLCRTDLHIQEGQWAEKSQVALPYTPGHENAGWIHEIGSGVTNVEVGDTVIVHPFIACGLCRACRRGDDMHCVNGSFPGINRDGGFADFLQTSARSVVKLAPGLGAEGHRGARRCRSDRDPRGQEGDPGARCRDAGGRDRRRRPRSHRDPVPEGVHAGGDHRGRPVRAGARAGGRDGGGPDRQGRRLSCGHRSGADRRGWCRGDHRLRRREGRDRGRHRDDPGRRVLLRDRLRRERQRPDDRHHLARDQLHREPRRHLHRPPGPDDPDRPGQGQPAHDAPTRSTRSTTRWPTSTAGGSRVAGS